MAKVSYLFKEDFTRDFLDALKADPAVMFGVLALIVLDEFSNTPVLLGYPYSEGN